MVETKAPAARKTRKPRGPFKGQVTTKATKVYNALTALEKAAKMRAAEPLEPAALEQARETLQTALDKAFDALGKIGTKPVAKAATGNLFRF